MLGDIKRGLSLFFPCPCFSQPNFVRELLARPAAPIYRGGTLDEAIDPDSLPPVHISAA